ncbi:MAG: hypothetical protein HYR96_09595 [Deltaproteobacteria bacterium]|nr:hypothetical protein [Deltaproteobacteria bacterium]
MIPRKPDSEKKWMVDFSAFVGASGAVSQKVSMVIRNQVRSDLNPTLRHVFAKSLTIHALVATLSLLACPQFGVGPLGGGMGLMRAYMVFGQSWCAIFCGATFLGLSSLLTAFLLRPEEIRRANRYGYAYIPAIATLSFVALMLGGGTTDLLSFILWSVGALLAGWGFLRLGATVRLGRLA